MKRILVTLVCGMLFFSYPVMATESTPEKAEPLATYDTEDGKVEFIDYVINDNDIAIVVDYTNTTDKNVEPAFQINIKVFQAGIEMERGDKFDIEGLRDAYTEIRPGTTIRIAEYFELESSEPIEVEFSQILSFSGKEPLYVNVDLGTNEITSKEGTSLGKGGGSLLGKVFEDAYDEVMDEYKEAYDETMDEYQNAIDEYTNEINDLIGSIKF